MSRPVKITLIASLALAFLLVSLGLASVLAARGAERTALEQLIADEAAGKAGEVTASLRDCGAGSECATRVSEMIGRLARPGGTVKILQIEQGTPLSPGAGAGVARIAWRPEGRLPVVQCVGVERTGSVLAGFSLSITAVSKPIDNEGACPDPGRVVNAG